MGKEEKELMLELKSKDKKREERLKEKAITAWNKRIADTGKTLTCFKCHGGMMINDELYELVRESYNKNNKDYLNEQMHKACKDMEISCFKCHGTGIHKAPILDDNGEWTDKWKSCHCEICAGTGKITLALYEKRQKRMRDKE